MAKSVVNINESKKETEADKIKGIDLKIDDSVQHLCEAYNASSGSTRSVIYVLFLINIILLIAVLNTHPWNWTDTRIKNSVDSVHNAEDSLGALVERYKQSRFKLRNDFKKNIALALDKYVKGKSDNVAKIEIDSIINFSEKYRQLSQKNDNEYFQNRLRDSDRIFAEMDKSSGLVKNEIDNSHHISIPLTGNSFDINDLAQVSGISFVILLIVLKFTLAREKDNLQIAFNAISERYDADMFDPEYKEYIDKLPGKIINMPNFKKLINFKRRRYHYNSLSMNEIFNLPKLDISADVLQKRMSGKIVKNHIFTFPFIVYLAILINDILTGYKGFEVSFIHTIISYILSFIWLSAIAFLSNSCNNQKKDINKLFDNFYHTNYTCNRSDFMKFVDKNRTEKIKDLFSAPFFIVKIVKDLRLLILNRKEHG